MNESKKRGKTRILHDTACFLFALFQIGYRANLTTSHMILFRGVQYDIVHIDPFEGYKADLKLYCKRKNK